MLECLLVKLSKVEIYFVLSFNCAESYNSCDGRVVKASDSKSDGVTRTGSNPVRSEMYFFQVCNQSFLL